MFNRMLVPYDGSMASETACALAIDLAEKYHSTVLVLTIGRPPEPALRFQMEPYLDEVRGHFRERFTVLGKRASAKGVKVRFDIRAGNAAEQIVRAVEENEIDLVIMGRRGKGEFQGWPLGTVSERVLTYASCAVLAIT